MRNFSDGHFIACALHDLVIHWREKCMSFQNAVIQRPLCRERATNNKLSKEFFSIILSEIRTRRSNIKPLGSLTSRRVFSSMPQKTKAKPGEHPQGVSTVRSWTRIRLCVRSTTNPIKSANPTRKMVLRDVRATLLLNYCLSLLRFFKDRSKRAGIQARWSITLQYSFYASIWNVERIQTSSYGQFSII